MSSFLWVSPPLGILLSGCPHLLVFPHLGAATSVYSVILCKPFLSSENSEQVLLLLVGAGFSLFSTVHMFDWYPVMCMLWPCKQRSISEGHSLTFSSINLASLVSCCCKLCSLTLFLKIFRFFLLTSSSPPYPLVIIYPPLALSRCHVFYQRRSMPREAMNLSSLSTPGTSSWTGSRPGWSWRRALLSGRWVPGTWTPPSPPPRWPRRWYLASCR